MIYLIDDKNLRQEIDYKWTSERFKKYEAYILPIYTLSDLQNKSQEIFQDGNIILYHESFLDKTSIHNEASERRRRLENFAKNKSSYLVLFSGSKNTRDLTDNTANLPVSVLYNNLEVFTKKFSEADINLEYLLFGENHKIEKELTDKLDSALLKTINEQVCNVQNKNLFIRPSKNNISNPLNNYVEKIIFNKVTDDDFSEKVYQWMNENLYDNIFVPLCFGSTLSDYNGLRLACHIRCTKTLNQNTRIFIYGFVGTDYLLQNEYFNILKTKNTFLIPFSKTSIWESTQKPYEKYLIEEIPNEIKKLKLDVPKNYFDSHSIANEWGIYQMARNANINIKEIEGFDQKKLNSLYFKWLITKNELEESIPEEQQKLQRKYEIELPGVKVIAKIDLSKLKR
jgi:hypothetical protein